MSAEAISSLWIGNRLSALERLCVHSFLTQGHPFHLYGYEPIENVPAGATLRDGNEILPADQIFCYQRGFGKGSPSAFSNMFRYKLLLDRGGWWCDLDVVCLRPFDYASDYVLGYERTQEGGLNVASAVIKAPVGNPLAEYCWNACRNVNKRRVRWGQIGPRLVQEGVKKFKLEAQVRPPDEFCPIDYWNVRQFISSEEMPADSRAIHLWHARWKLESLDPDARFDPECLYERLKSRYLPPDDAGFPSPDRREPKDNTILPPAAVASIGAGLLRKMFRRAG